MDVNEDIKKMIKKTCKLVKSKDVNPFDRCNPFNEELQNIVDSIILPGNKPTKKDILCRFIKKFKVERLRCGLSKPILKTILFELYNKYYNLDGPVVHESDIAEVDFLRYIINKFDQDYISYQLERRIEVLKYFGYVRLVQEFFDKDIEVDILERYSLLIKNHFYL